MKAMKHKSKQAKQQNNPQKSQMKNKPWHKCDWCGKFIPLDDFYAGHATRVMLSPDTAFTAETYQNKCKACNQQQTKRENQTTQPNEN